MQEEQDLRLLQLLRSDGVPLPDLLQWLHGHHGPGPPSPDLPALEMHRFHTKNPANYDDWKQQLAVTNPQSFAVTFLNYVRAEVQPLIAAADSTADVVGKSSLSSSECKETQLPEEKKSEATRVPEPVKLAAVDSWADRNGVIGTSSVDSFAVLPGKQKERRKSTGSSLPSRPSKLLELPVYEEDFPALGKMPTVNAPRKPTQSKQKRRVTPTPTVNPVVDSAFILAKVETTVGDSQSHNNKVKSSGLGQLKVDMDILMQRCEKNRNQKQKEKPEPVKKDSFKAWSAEKLETGLRSPRVAVQSLRSGSPLKTQVKYNVDNVKSTYTENASPSSTSLVSTSTITDSDLARPANFTSADNGSPTLGTISPLQLSRTLTSMAAVHAALMVVKLVPSLLEELHFLLQLLSLEPAFSAGVSVGTNRALDTITEVTSEKVLLFSSGDACAGYACFVLEQAGRILDCAGEQILVALVEEPAIARHSPTLLVRLKASLTDQQAAALRSFKAYEAASRTNSTFEQFSVGASNSKTTSFPGLPVSLPFQAARDSRNIFKTQEEQRAYNNREQCRDQFYAIIREAASAYSAFGWISSGSEGEGFLKMKDAVHQFLHVLLVENYPWFAELFLEQVLQVSNCKETDPEVISLAKQDPAKLQRLHDRLTSTTTLRLSAVSQKHGGNGSGNAENRLTLSPSSPWSQVKNMERRLSSKKAGVINNFSAGSVQILHKGRSAVGNLKDKSFLQADGGSRFSCYFPQAMCVYVWFLEAADSHRLNTQMLWSIKRKIAVLTELPPYSRDAADIGSGFTQRVLALKALAGLLGYLFVSPGAGARPPAPGPGTPDGTTRSIWDVNRSEPPVDVPSILTKARMEGSILLNLPWVLEFLHLLKADWQALSHPHFEAIVSALRDVYLLPMLDPTSEKFGVGSICILASLDGFFEYMELSSNSNEWPNKGRSSSLSPPVLKANRSVEGKDTRKHAEMQAEVAGGFEGLDTMLGIVDARYIQHCCPLLMDLRGVLVEGKKRRQRQRDPNLPDSPGVSRARSVRKITPIQRPGPSQHIDISVSVKIGENLTTIMSSDLQEDQLKLKLQRTFLEQRPHLRRVADFVVDTVAGNAARAAVLKLVPPALQTALQKLQMVLRGHSTEVSSAVDLRDTQWSATKGGGQVEMAVEHIITSTIHQLLSPALEYAKLHAADRTAEALSALADPEESSFVLGVAASIAAETAGLAASRKALASISGEIRKRITDEVESWRRKSLQDRDFKTPLSSDLSMSDNLRGPTTSGFRQTRTQSWPKAAKQQPSAEALLSSSESENINEPFLTCDQLIGESTSVRVLHAHSVPEINSLITGGSISEVSPKHVIVKAEAHKNSVVDISSVKVLKSFAAVKRQLSFSMKEHTTTSIDLAPTLGVTTSQTDKTLGLVNCNSEKLKALEDRLNNKPFSHISRDISDSLNGGLVTDITSIDTWSTRPSSRNNLQCKEDSPVDAMSTRCEETHVEVHDPSFEASLQPEFTKPQTLAERVLQACNNACYFCSLEPFKDGSRHCLRQYLAVLCVSLEGLLSQIQGATPAGGFDALVFRSDSHVQYGRLGGEPPSEKSNLPSMQLRVELGLVRRTVALALHLLLWDPFMVLGSCEMPVGNVTKFTPNSQGSICEGATTLPGTIITRISSLNLTGIGFTDFQQQKESKGGGEVMNALVMTWRRLVECQIVSTRFLVVELLTPWRWKLALVAQPWQPGNFEQWSSNVKEGMASVLINMMGAAGSGLRFQDLDSILCMFLRTMVVGRLTAFDNGGDIAFSHQGDFSESNLNCMNSRTRVSLADSSVNSPSRSGRKDDFQSSHESGSLATGLALCLLQHYSSASHNNVELLSANAPGDLTHLQKLIGDLGQEFGRGQIPDDYISCNFFSQHNDSKCS